MGASKLDPKSALIQVGCKCPARKQMDDGDAYLETEILAIRPSEGGDLEYYVHYTSFNRRLDEWISLESFDLSRLEPPPKSRGKKGSINQAGHFSKLALGNKASKIDSKRLLPEEEEEDSLEKFNKEYARRTLFSSDSAEGGDSAELSASAKEREIENLRRGGSMTQRQEEISRVRNIWQIEMGKYRVNTWYFSPYPQEICDDKGTLFICEFCLMYFGCKASLQRHTSKCTLRHPPGHEIYRKGLISFFEIDGHKQKTYCRNLCLLSKLFLDHKTLYYDVDPFIFYILTECDQYGCHMLGYFSKEKESSENYNLACILTLPQYQRKGYGKVLIAFSYELAKRTEHIGSPEKPLSDLGLISYRSYWAEEIVRTLQDSPGNISIQRLSELTCITCEDILHTLQALDLLYYVRGQHVILLCEKVLAETEKSKAKQRIQIDPACLRWDPPLLFDHRLSRYS